jgi:hypothetical protein
VLNHLDIFVRNGLPGIEIPLPHILETISLASFMKWES